ncbi:type IX secretion system outer membrane channel protein PorV [Luteibaculum oceani]|uniref:Type IX secretion system outer membrane channel protein PorV n=1 Tax=Luteibaculum oceani TaxID=1294296 RepID=A0A5C6V3V3_9FLAO|nr:type IX secretion system outer membrane channel protein PorV [Luteibaculum oceani]TXC78328.1 type IX secretion system outer membrane channel protein PorV [Luteibaculum oceani]
MRILSTAILFLLVLTSYGQNSQKQEEFRDAFNAITTAVPVLNIAPDSRSSAMGDVGVSTTPDVNSIHWNPAKLAFLNDDFGISLSYVPWLRTFVPDMNIAYLSAFKKIDKTSTLGASLRYFSMGNIVFTDQSANRTGEFTPNEFAFDVAYALKMSEYFSTGVSLRFIYSNLTGGNQSSGSDTKPGTAFAFDASLYYTSDEFQISDIDAKFRGGLNFSNIGNKITYNTGGARDKNFLPMNMRLGGGITLELDQYNDLTFNIETNKLLVPTPGGTLDTSSADVSVATAVFGSFSDAPGGTREELQEFNLGFGVEYNYDDKLAFRTGFFHEPQNKGNRQYITMGAGLAYSMLQFDLSYLIPTQQNSPFANSLRITISALIDKKSSEDETPPTLN